MKTVYVGISKIQRINTKQLRELKDILLVEEFSNRPLVAVIPYQEYLRMQTLIIKADESIAFLKERLEQLVERDVARNLGKGPYYKVW